MAAETTVSAAKQASGAAREVVIADSYCPKCGQHFNALSWLDGGALDSPLPGDMSVCVNCASILMFEQGLQCALAPEGRLLSIPSKCLEQLLRLSDHVREMKGQPRPRYTATILSSSKRAGQWREIFGGLQAPVRWKLPLCGVFPNGRHAPHYLIDVERLTPAQREHAVAVIARQWALSPDQVLESWANPEHGFPIGAQDVLVLEAT